tara:strand:- start:29501 stop:30181 length:681 start_codon:yes stop_codon:yes gene_type:complete
MKITKQKLKRIIREAQRSLGVDSPLAPFTDEDSEKKDDLLGMFSDAYKYRWGVRPSGDTMQHMFATMTADQIAKEIDKEYDAAHEAMEAEEEYEKAAEERAARDKEIKAMQPDPEHREELVKRSGMRRRTEGKQMKITKRQLKRIIREAIAHHHVEPWQEQDAQEVHDLALPIFGPDILVDVIDDEIVIDNTGGDWRVQELEGQWRKIWPVGEWDNDGILCTGIKS